MNPRDVPYSFHPMRWCNHCGSDRPHTDDNAGTTCDACGARAKWSRDVPLDDRFGD